MYFFSHGKRICRNPQGTESSRMSCVLSSTVSSHFCVLYLHTGMICSKKYPIVRKSSPCPTLFPTAPPSNRSRSEPVIRYRKQFRVQTVFQIRSDIRIFFGEKLPDIVLPIYIQCHCASRKCSFGVIQPFHSSRMISHGPTRKVTAARNAQGEKSNH